MRDTIRSLEGSRIRQVVNAALGQPDVLRFWFGESDEVTPEAVREAAIRSLQDGETFYNHNLGIPELRAGITGYMQRTHPLAADRLSEARIGATSSGVSALMLATQAIVDAGSRVVAVTPVWPNLIQQSIIMGAQVHDVPLHPVDGEWRLDLQRLLDAVTPETRLLLINAPNNPTGWTLTRDEQQAILEHCRRTGTWILADEVYERLYYEPTPNACAPSFLDIAGADDRLVVAHSFSKTFLMTGWRLGWLVMPESLTPHVSKLIEFNTSCAPTFVQRAGIEAIRREPEITPGLVAHFRHCRDTLVPLLQQVPGVSVQPARGGMYAFFRIAGHDDSQLTARRLVAEAGLGLAPGSAFTPMGRQVASDWLRWCFASRDVSRLQEGVRRLRGWLGA